MLDSENLRILVVDDSALFRKIIQEILNEIPGVKIIGTAQNGKIALSKTIALRPHLLTLDLEMPEMNGLEVLERLQEQASEVGAIVVSAHTMEGAASTLTALELGAFDFVTKPVDRNLDTNKRQLKSALAPALEAFDRIRKVKQIFRQGGTTAHSAAAGSSPLKTLNLASHNPHTVQAVHQAKVIAIAISTGGPAALTRIIPRIPADVDVPIFIVQHMPPLFTTAFASRLNSISQLQVVEATDGMVALPNTVYLAPGGKQMKVKTELGNIHKKIQITDDPPENNCRPSADYLFRSIAESYGHSATGVIMTGMGSDGTRGLKLMKAKGATIIAQDETTSTVYSMPKGPVEAGIVDVIAPLDAIADEICRTVKRKVNSSGRD